MGPVPPSSLTVFLSLTLALSPNSLPFRPVGGLCVVPALFMNRNSVARALLFLADPVLCAPSLVLSRCGLRSWAPL